MSEALRIMVAVKRDLVTEKDERGATMLHHAASSENSEVLEFLLDHGASTQQV